MVSKITKYPKLRDGDGVPVIKSNRNSIDYRNTGIPRSHPAWMLWAFAWFQKGMQIYKSRSQIIVCIQIYMIKPRSSQQLIGAAWSQKYRDPSASQGNGRYQHFFAAFGFTSIGQINVKLGCFPVPHFLWLWGPANNNRYVAEHYLSKQLR